MRRLFTCSMIFILLLGTLLIPGTAVAQDSSLCDAYEPLDTASGVKLRGGSGNQVLIGSNGPDVLRGGSGNDILCGFGGEDTLVGGSGNDWIGGGADADVLRGNSGNDTLANGESNRPGSGNDDVVTITAPFLTVVWTVHPSGDGFTGEVTGAGLQPDASVTITGIHLSGGEIEQTLGTVQDNGTIAYFFGNTACYAFASVTFSTIDQDGNPIATDGSVPC